MMIFADEDAAPDEQVRFALLFFCPFMLSFCSLLRFEAFLLGLWGSFLTSLAGYEQPGSKKARTGGLKMNLPPPKNS